MHFHCKKQLVASNWVRGLNRKHRGDLAGVQPPNPPIQFAPDLNVLVIVIVI